MGSKFPESGIAAILDLHGWSGNVNRYVKDVGRMNKVDKAAVKQSGLVTRARQQYTKVMKTAGDVGKKTAGIFQKDLGKAFPKVTKLLKKFTGGMGKTLGKMDFLPGSFKAALGGVTQFTAGLTGMIGVVSLGTAALAVFAAALIGLGMRGANMRGVVEAFDVGARKAGIYADVLLNDLSKAARGTITELKLMQTANLALAGAKGEVAEALGKGGGLAGLMEIAQVQARATGQSVDYMFNSLVTGVKRGTPLLIDNTGLVLKVSAANEEYARSIGKSVDQLTVEEKQIALLNATLAAGKEAMAGYGEQTATAGERIRQINTSIANTLDRLALSVQPFFENLLGYVKTFVDAVVWPINTIVIPIIYELTNALFGPLTRAWERTTSIIKSVFTPFAKLIHRWIVVIVGVIRAFGAVWDWVLNQITSATGGIAGVLKKYFVEPLAALLDPVNFARRAGQIIAAFAQGLMWAANKFVYPAVIFIATLIADFLQGFSPPKKGPLSRIDEGGANVMQAWLAGFTGVSLSPISDMAGRVDQALGVIGGMTHKQVERRLARLDTALQPFVDNLDIAKAKMEAVVEPLKIADDIMSKRLSENVKKFFGGELSAEQMRTFDAQRVAIRERLNAASAMTEQSEMQLALMRSQQAVERALLAIQLRRTATDKKKKKKGKQEKDTAAATATGGAGTGDDPATAAGGAGGMLPSQGDPLGGFLGVTQDEIDALFGDMGDAFMEGFESPGFAKELAQFEVNRGALQEQFGRIGESSPFQGLKRIFNDVFGDGEDSVRTKVTDFVGDVTKFFTEDLPGVFDGFTLDALTTAVDDAVSSVYSWVLGAGSDAGDSLKGIFEGIDLGEWLPDDILGTLEDMLWNPVKNLVGNIYSAIFGGGGRDAEVSDPLKAQFEGIGPGFKSWLQGIGDNLDTALLQPVRKLILDVWNAVFSLDNEESMASYFVGLPAKFGEWLGENGSKVVTWLNKTLLDPAVGVVNQLLNKLGAIGDAVRRILGIGGGADVPSQYDDLLREVVPGLDVEAPVTAQGAKGGRARAGEKWIVGEKGWEFFKPDVNGQIIPHDRSVAMLRRMMRQERPASKQSPWLSAAFRQFSDPNRQRARVDLPPQARPYVIDKTAQPSFSVSQTFTGRNDARSVRRAWYELRAAGAVN